ncbi:MAG: hypothetical protein V3R82_05780 [Candidatus Hydrothermarchaeales archaeon]
MPLGDVLLIKPGIRKVAAEISELILKDLSDEDKIIVAVGGESGSGKSEVAHEISNNLNRSPRGIKSFILTFDDFYIFPRKERNKLRLKTNFGSVGLSEVDQVELKYIVTKFKKDAGLTLIPIYDIRTNIQHRLVVNFQDIPVLIIDGLYANSLYADYNVFIERSYRDTLDFQKERGKEAMDEFRQSVLEKEHEAVMKLVKNANFIITKDYKLKKVKRMI